MDEGTRKYNEHLKSLERRVVSILSISSRI